MVRLQDDDLLNKKENFSLRIEFNELISQRILDLCNNENITPHRLAALSELTPPTLDRLVKGEVVNPTFLTLLSIAMGLNIKLSCLLDFEGINQITFRDLRRYRNVIRRKTTCK